LVGAVVVDLADPSPPVALTVTQRSTGSLDAPRSCPAGPGHPRVQCERDSVGRANVKAVVGSVQLDGRAQTEMELLGIGVELAVINAERHRQASEPWGGIEDVVHGHLAGEGLPP